MTDYTDHTLIEEEVVRVVEQAKELQELAASVISRSSKDEQNLRQRAIAIDSAIKKLRSSMNSHLFDRQLDPKLAEKDRTALLFLLFPSRLLILRSWIWDGCMPAFPVQLYLVDMSSLLCSADGSCESYMGNQRPS